MGRGVKGPDGLTEMQRKFIEAYLVNPNARQAALIAGASPGRAAATASDWLRYPMVSNEIKRRMAERQKKYDLTEDFIIKKLLDIVSVPITDFFDENDEGLAVLKPLDILTDEAKCIIQEIDLSKQRVKVCDKIKALELLGRHVGLFTAKETTTTGDTNPLAEALHRAAKSIWK